MPPLLLSNIFLVFGAFIFGLLIGSFLNVCVFRLPRDLSVVRPARSFCPGCEHTIAWFDNIPLLSYALLRGRCRYCKEWIPLRYPLVELATGVAFALCAVVFGLTAAAAKYAIFAAIVIDLMATDLEERILPDEFTLGGTLAGVVIAAFVPMPLGLARLVLSILGLQTSATWFSVIESASGALVVSCLIWFVGWVYQKIRHREGLGLGDVKMIAMIGAFLGLEGALLTLMLASLLGAVGGLAYIKIARKDAGTYELPFGMFLGLAALLIAAYAEAMKPHLR